MPKPAGRAVAAAVLVLSPLAAATCTAQPIVRTAREVRLMTRGEASAGVRVELAGVVTFANPNNRIFFLQDATAGIYVAPPGAGEVDLTPGDRVRVVGRSTPGTFAPSVRPALVERLGAAELPTPEVFSFDLSDSRWLDGQYVQAWAYVQAVGLGDNRTALKVATRDGEGAIEFPLEFPQALEWIGRTVRARGVPVPGHDIKSRASLGTKLLVQTPDDVAVLPSAPNMDRPLDIEQLTRGYLPVPPVSARPVAVLGWVTGRFGPQWYSVQDGTGAAFVRSSLYEPEFGVGDSVRVTGYLDPGGPGVLLENATIQAAGLEVRPPVPLERSVDQAIRERLFARLVRLSGFVERAAYLNGKVVINVRDGPARFVAFYTTDDPAGLDALVPGSEVAVTGVYSVARGEGAAGFDGPALNMRSGDDLKLLALPPGPPWWTSTRVCYLVGGLVGLVSLVSLWVLMLRRQVRKQTAQMRAVFDEQVKLREGLQEAKRLESIARLVGGIAHDFKNLLTVILGNINLAQLRVDDDEVTLGLIHDAEAAGRRAADLTRRLLTYSRQDVVTLVPTEVGPVISESDALLRRIIGEQIELVTRCDEGLPAVIADAGLLQQVVMNLAVNSRDAMPGGGRLSIRVTRHEGGVRLTVADTGVGMDELIRERIFEPFFTTKPVGQGTGLGLATVYGIVNRLNGSIRVDSELGRGSTFTIDVPPAPNYARVESTQKTAPPREGPPLNILFVEDDESVRKSTVRTMRQDGHTVTAPDTPESALAFAKGEGAKIDILVTDVVMPGLGGLTLAELVREIRPGIPVLFMSGYPADARQSVEGFPDSAFIQKPFTAKELTERIHTLFAGR